MDRELSLDELLAASITRQLMARDQVDEAQVRALATRVRAGLRNNDPERRPPEPRVFID